jgi:hypothetical protein
LVRTRLCVGVTLRVTAAGQRALAATKGQSPERVRAKTQPRTDAKQCRHATATPTQIKAGREVMEVAVLADHGEGAEGIRKGDSVDSRAIVSLR